MNGIDWPSTWMSKLWLPGPFKVDSVDRGHDVDSMRRIAQLDDGVSSVDVINGEVETDESEFVE